MLTEAIEALERAGYVIVTEDANGDLVLTPTVKLIETIERRGLTLDDLT